MLQHKFTKSLHFISLRVNNNHLRGLNLVEGIVNITWDSSKLKEGIVNITWDSSNDETT
jgi:hypothetical protein